MARSFWASVPKSLAITLVCGEIATEADGPNLVGGDDIDYRYHQYPAVKIARLAVDIGWRARGLGSALVQLAIGTTLDAICPSVGCRFIIVDAKQASMRFYRNMGFTTLDTAENRSRDTSVMFIDLAKLQPDGL